MRDAIVPVLRVPAEVAVEPVSHVQELLSDHHFERPRLRAIDARQVDQDEMFTGCRRKRIGAADRAPQPASQPTFEDSALGGDAEAVCWQPEERDVSFEMPARFLVVDQPAHDGDLQGDENLHRGESGTGGGFVCGARSSYRICGLQLE